MGNYLFTHWYNVHGRIESLQESGCSNELINVLNGLILVTEDDRLDLEDLMTEDGAKLL